MISIHFLSSPSKNNLVTLGAHKTSINVFYTFLKLTLEEQFRDYERSQKYIDVFYTYLKLTLDEHFGDYGRT